MTSESESSISGPRRVARVAAATGLAAALIATGALPVFAAPAADDPAASAPVKPADSASAKLGSADVDLLDKAVAEGEKNVTVMVATAPGQTGQVSDQFEAVSGAVVGKTYDKLGYVRATLPTGKAEAALKAATKLSSVHGIDLKHEIELDDPTPAADTVKGAAKAKGAKAASTAPGANTPAKNPFNPSFETGAVDFVKQNPKADGRGVTIGILDSGIDLGHPSLQKTSTGERKIVDWVTATDPVNDGDGTWRPMQLDVKGPSFTVNNRTYTAPASTTTSSTCSPSPPRAAATWPGT